MNLKNRPIWPWELDRVLITFEAIFFFVTFFLFGGMARLGAATDSVGEWLSNFFVLRFMKEDSQKDDGSHIHNDHGSCAVGHPHDHRREKATENVGIIFFGLAISTLLFHLFTGERIPEEGMTWVTWGAGFFTVSTGVLGVVKLVKSKLKKGSPLLADALQSLLCVLASGITIIADLLHSRFEQSHVVGEALIVALMAIAGTVILKTKKLCC